MAKLAAAGKLNRPLNNDELGNLGEREFAHICASTSLIVNEISKDRTGWDFYVEFPYDHASGASLDTRRNPITCKVQVKAQWQDNDRIVFRLSSLERLAKDPNPAFICVFKYDHSRKCVGGYLIHLADDVLARILKRLRAERKRGRTKVNDSEMVLYASRSGVPFEPNGDALVQAILNVTGQNAAAYAAKKASQLVH